MSKPDKENEWRAWVQKGSFGLFVVKDKDSNPEYANKPFEVVKKSDYDSLKAELEKARELIREILGIDNKNKPVIETLKDARGWEVKAKEFLKKEGE